MTNKFLINMQHGTAVAMAGSCSAHAPSPADDILPGYDPNITSILSTLIRAPSDERTGRRRAEVPQDNNSCLPHSIGRPEPSLNPSLSLFDVDYDKVAAA